MKSDEIYYFILWITSFEVDNRVYGYLPHYYLMEFIHIQGLITRIFDGFRHFFSFFNHVIITVIHRQIASTETTANSQLQGFMIYFSPKARTIYDPKV